MARDSYYYSSKVAGFRCKILWSSLDIFAGSFWDIDKYFRISVLSPPSCPFFLLLLFYLFKREAYFKELFFQISLQILFFTVGVPRSYNETETLWPVQYPPSQSSDTPAIKVHLSHLSDNLPDNRQSDKRRKPMQLFEILDISNHTNKNLQKKYSLHVRARCNYNLP